MNAFTNPFFLSKMLKSYFFDIDRLKKIDEEELQRYQNKRLKKMVTFAYTVPLYHDLYKKTGVHPGDIQGIKDITKLPLVTKDDIKRYYPTGIVSSKTKKNKLVEVSTSGTTGKSLSLYVDFFDIMMGFFGYIRELREYGINWRKTKMTIIGDFAPHTVESGYVTRGLGSRLNIGKALKNMQWLNTNDTPRKLIEEIDSFQPEFLGGYVGMLGHLALLKEKGFGDHIAPRCIAATGTVLTPGLRRFIEQSFQAQVFETYGSTETGPLAFQCQEGGYHLMSDFVYPEFLQGEEPVSSGEPGKLVVTKLYGYGTPIIRSTAVNDIVAPLYESCSCGMAGHLIKKIYGRDDLSLVFSGGRILLASGISDVYSRVLYELKTNKLKDTQVIQRSLNHLEVNIVVDHEVENVEPSVEQIGSVITNGFREKVGSDIEIVVREVDQIPKQEPRVISKVNRLLYPVTSYL